MGKLSPNISTMSQRDWLRLHLQESNFNQGLDDNTIDKIVKFKFDYPKSLHSLPHFVNNVTGITRIIFYGKSYLATSLSSWIDHFDKREMAYEMNFDVDPLFGFKVFLAINRSV